jgi:hypothetical protein
VIQSVFQSANVHENTGLYRRDRDQPAASPL